MLSRRRPVAAYVVAVSSVAVFFQQKAPHDTPTAARVSTQIRQKPEAVLRHFFAEALADHVDAALLPSTASRKLPEWVAKLQDAVALNCCKGDASGERGAAQ